MDPSYQLRTLSTTNGLGRYFQPSSLPGAEDLTAEWLDLRTKIDAEYADTAKVRDKLATRKREARAAEDYPRQAALAKREGTKPPKDPRPGARDKIAEAEAELEVQEQVLVDLSEEIEDWRKGHKDALVEIPRDLREEIGERAPRIVAEAAELFDSFNAAARTEAWVLGNYKPPQPLGSKVVNDFERAVRDTLTPPRTVYVRPAERKKLGNEQDAVDVDGNRLPYAETDAAVRAGSIRIKVVYSPAARDVGVRELRGGVA